MRLPFILQINLLLAAGIACFGGIGLVVYLSVTDIAETARQEVRVQKTIAAVHRAFAVFRDMEARHRRYLIAGDREDWDQYRELEERLASEAFQLKALLNDSAEQRSHAEQLGEDLRLRVATLELASARLTAEGREAAFGLLRDSAYQEAGNRIRARTAEMVRLQEDMMQRRRARTDADVQRMASVSATAAVAALAMMVWVLVVIGRYRRDRDAREAELRDAKERLELALEGSGLALWDADVASGHVYLDGRWMEMLGGPRGETRTSVGELLEMVHPDDRGQLRQVSREIAEGTREDYRVEHRVLARNRDWRWILSRGRVVERDARGRARRMAGTNADVTERRAAERMKSEFISVVSHELRTPLTSLSGALELLKGGVAGPLPAEAAPLLDIAARNADRLSGLVNDILDLEKVEAGMMRFEPRAVDLAELLRQALEANRTYALRFGVEFELAPVPAGARVNADPDRIMQVLANLLSNAAKFSPEGSPVEVAAGMRDGWARVSVRDHGPGLAPEFRERLFQKFAQQDTSDTARRGGTGLGLAISKAMVEHSGGRIGHEPAPDGGSVFWFELPAA